MFKNGALDWILIDILEFSKKPNLSQAARQDECIWSVKFHVSKVEGVSGAQRIVNKIEIVNNCDIKLRSHRRERDRLLLAKILMNKNRNVIVTPLFHVSWRYISW